MNNIAFLYIALFSVAGFAGELSFGTSVSRAIVLNTSGYSCQSLVESHRSGNQPLPDVAGSWFSIPRLTVNWNHSRPVRIDRVSFTIKNESIIGGNYQCVLAGKDLLYSWLANYNPLDSNSAQSIDLTNISPISSLNPSVPGLGNACPMACGGVQFNHPNKDSNGSLFILVHGTTLAPDGSIVEVQDENEIEYFFQGTGSL